MMNDTTPSDRNATTRERHPYLTQQRKGCLLHLYINPHDPRPRVTRTQHFGEGSAFICKAQIAGMVRCGGFVRQCHPSTDRGSNEGVAKHAMPTGDRSAKPPLSDRIRLDSLEMATLTAAAGYSLAI